MFKRKRLWIIPVIVALVAVTGVFAAPASLPGADEADVALAAGPEQPKEHCIHANQEQLSKIKKLWGQDIKFVEFLKLVAPEVLEGIFPRMSEQASVSTLYWPAINNGLRAEELSDIDICWGYLDNEEMEWFWVWLGSNSKEIQPTTLDCLYSKVPATTEHPCKGVTIVVDNVGKPTLGPVIDVPPEMLKAERQKWESEGVVQEEVSKRVPLTGSSRLSGGIEPMGGTCEAHAMAWWEGMTGLILTGSEVYQKFEWDGENVVEVLDYGGYHYAAWPVWRWIFGMVLNAGDNPPCWKTAFECGNRFKNFLGGQNHGITVWSYAYGDGHVSGARNFSGNPPSPAYKKFTYWIE